MKNTYEVTKGKSSITDKACNQESLRIIIQAQTRNPTSTYGIKDMPTSYVVELTQDVSYQLLRFWKHDR